MKRQKLTGRIVPPKGDGPFLIYRSLVSDVDPSQFDASRWPAIEPPTELSELRGSTVFYRGTYYTVELTPEAMAALDEPWLEAARALGRAMADWDFNRERERQRQALINRAKTD